MAKYQSKHTGAQIDSGIDKVSILEIQANSMNERISTIENSMITDVYTKEESDAKYILKDDVYTKEEADLKYVLKDETYTKEEADAKYATNETVGELEGDIQELGNRIDNIQPSETVDAYTKEESDAKYALKTVVEELGQTVAGQGAAIEEYASAVEGVSGTISGVQSDVQELSARVDNIKPVDAYTKTESDDKYAPKTAVETLNTTVADYGITIDQNSSAIQTINSNISKVQGDVQELSDRLSNIESEDDIDAYTKAESDEKYATIDSVETNANDILNLKGRISTLESEPIRTISIEEVNIASESWVEMSGIDPYTHYAVINVLNLENGVSIELINNQPVLFAQYGFAIGKITAVDEFEIYSIGRPISDVVLVFEMHKVLSVYTGSYTEE